MFRKTVLLDGGPCHGMSVVWDGGSELRMVRCLKGFAPWPRNAAPPLVASELYRASIDSPSIFVWADGAHSTARHCPALDNAEAEPRPS